MKLCGGHFQIRSQLSKHRVEWKKWEGGSSRGLNDQSVHSGGLDRWFKGGGGHAMRLDSPSHFITPRQTGMD